MIVIGAGIAGITAAIHLARAGLQVTVLDKDVEPGGRCGRLIRDGHRFDTGPTLFVMPHLYEAEFEALGTSIHDRLELHPVDPTYGLVFDDGSRLWLTSDTASMRQQLDAIEPGGLAGLRSYLRNGRRQYEGVIDGLVNRDFRRATDVVNFRTLALLLHTNPFMNHYRSMGKYFSSPRLKSAFSFQDLYVGLSPFNAPSTLSMLPYTELAHGVWSPRGGMYSIVETLVDLASMAGVEFRLKTTVTQIDTQARTVRGVTLADGSHLRADVVLANADLPYVYRDLLPPSRTADALWRKEFSSSAVSFFWGVDRTYDALGPHTLFLAEDYRENFDTIVRDLGLPSNPSLYIHAPARMEPSMAPPGEDTLTAIVPVGHLRDGGGQDWNELREQARGQVFRRLRTLGITDLETHIKFEESRTPVTWAERHNLAKGSTHGLSHKMTQMACFRPSNRHRRYRNLYFAGASTHPGTGVPTAMVSGRFAAARIAADLRSG